MPTCRGKLKSTAESRLARLLCTETIVGAVLARRWWASVTSWNQLASTSKSDISIDSHCNLDDDETYLSSSTLKSARTLPLPLLSHPAVESVVLDDKLKGHKPWILLRERKGVRGDMVTTLFGQSRLSSELHPLLMTVCTAV